MFNSGANVGAIIAPAIIPWITPSFRLARGIPCHRSLQPAVDRVVAQELPQTVGIAQADERRVHYIYSDTGAQMEPGIPWLKLLTYRQTWAFSTAKFLTDPVWWFYLFWLPSYFDSRFHLGLSHLGLPLIVVYNVSIGSVAGGWRLHCSALCI